MSVGCLVLACSNEGDDGSEGGADATMTTATSNSDESSSSGGSTGAGSTAGATDDDGAGSTEGGEATAAGSSEGTDAGESSDESSSGADGSEGGSTTGVSGPCGIDNPCPNGQACVFEEGDCGMGGMTTCEDAPQICPLDYNPVCACDFMTYANACTAYAAGQSILHPGEC